MSDGTFTYAYNSAGRMVQAESVTVTLVYTYTAQGLRVAQSVDGNVTTFFWDWAYGVPEMLREGGNLYLVGHETLGRWDGASWAYHLPDALGSVRQEVDGAGAVVSSREWTPYGVEVGAGQAGLGYAGEWWDSDAELLYLRARWYEPGTGRFTQRDLMTSILNRNGGYNAYVYVSQNPINSVDPSGYFSEYEIAYSLGVSTFEEVIQMFRGDAFSHPGGYGRWGFLRLLQKAKTGDTLSWLSVGFFGKSDRVPVGQFYSSGCTIRVANQDLRLWMLRFFSSSTEERQRGFPWRDVLAAYYLNNEPFRDGYGGYNTDLPDFASVLFNLDVYAPAGWGGVGIGAGAAYIVDRYGRAYISVVPLTSIGIGLGPGSIGYTEGYVNRWQGGGHIASPEELDILIPGASLGGSVNLLIFGGSAEINLDDTWDNYWMGAVGVVIGQIGVNLDLSFTRRLRQEYSVNPQGWYWVEELLRYEEYDISRQ